MTLDEIYEETASVRHFSASHGDHITLSRLISRRFISFIQPLLRIAKRFCRLIDQPLLSRTSPPLATHLHHTLSRESLSLELFCLWM